ncbi:ANK_REP_REGION domain-containing protein [Trichoderma simmonsii]|uniref:ANK_REP_REGION domain-containing protein n=1 Tax=Trichoderma simmonsii TaxID=1491479 RepID=A0A8G0PJD8_9HYPO|nr:ANK_REP_REGION domain-containing protein [Trichoderma simmonsii]
MRLINVKTFKLEEFLDYQAPPYAILSHTWGDDSEELSFRDVEDGNINKLGIGSVKFRGCCRQAAEDSLGYAWIDTCCIDKTNLVELSEAINSMFRWYQRASICYAFLSDVPSDDHFKQKSSKFRRSRWFQRGWTLQELLAPKTMRFYGAISPSDTHSGQAFVDTNLVQEWHLLGNKGNMSTTIASITGIPRHYLLGITALHTASVAQRMSWAAHRDTKRKEDLAYCLLGIFNITMPMIYGEGGEQAFFRLQEQIMKVTRDDSILAWGLGTDDSSTSDTGNITAGRIVAKGPADFTHSGNIVRRDQTLKYTSSVDMSGGSIRAHLPLHTTLTGEIIGLLSCGPENNPQQVVGIPLIELSVGSSGEYARPRGYEISLYPTTVAATKPKPIRIKHDNQENVPVDVGGLFFHYEDDDFTDISLKIVDVAPRSYWDEERALITSTPITQDGAVGQILIRLRHDTQDSKDFVVILEYKKESSDTLVKCWVLICSRNLLLEELVLYLPSMMQKLDGKRRARNELLSLTIALERVEQQPIFVIRPELVLDGVFTTIDATVELEEKKLIRESLQLLEENEETERESNKLEDEMNSCDTSLNEIKKDQETILAKLKELEMRQKALIAKEAEYTGKRTEITTKQDEVKTKLSGLSTQWENIQERWDTLGQFGQLSCALPGTTVLQWAAAKGLIEVVKQRLEDGADVNGSDQDGYTPLMTATISGQFEVATLLIEHGARIDAQTRNDETALIAAAASGCVQLVQLLVDKGADVEGPGNSDALQAAAFYGHADVVRLLLDHGAQIEARAGTSLTALLSASNRGHTDVVQLLLDRGADVEAKNWEGVTALVAAFKEGKKDVVKLLINRGAQVDICDEDGKTMLIRASAGGDTEIVEQLLAIGKINLNARDKEGRTALEWATQNGHGAIIQLLLNARKHGREQVHTESLQDHSKFSGSGGLHEDYWPRVIMPKIVRPRRLGNDY